MIILFIVSIVVLIIGIITYPKWSYREYYKRCIKNSKHPDWEPYCGKNFLEDDYFNNLHS